ncbi:Hypothetical predicted protein [Podarcis lilfordi]|uniref:Uncharacterized protein n=1 Tax=Podarcis lilfordi TaxID=74358 RepID=A0AA35KVQ0_9SAUR|nr:Hypothetical predicted protein [Podarcis lilfordi]
MVERETLSQRAKQRQRHQGPFSKWKLVKISRHVLHLHRPPSRSMSRMPTTLAPMSLLKKTLNHKDNHCQAPLLSWSPKS